MPRTTKPTDPAAVIRAQVVLDEHDMSADGRFAVVARRSVVRDRYRSHLWLIPLASGGRPVQLTDGNVRDTHPRVAPDGSAVTFKRSHGTPARGPAKHEPESEVLVLPIGPAGRPGRAWPIRIPKDRGVDELEWSPDGRRLALTIEVDPPRFLVGPTPTGDDEPTARRITRLDWQWDEAGPLDRWSHVHVVDARRGAVPRQLTRGDWGASKLAWSPDGRSIAFAADLRPDADLLPTTSIWTIDTADGGAAEPREVIALGGVDKPAWSPDGRWIAAVAYVPERALDDDMPQLVIGPSDGSSTAWALAPQLDLPVGTWNDTDMHGWMASSRTTPAWVDDRTIVTVVTNRGRAQAWRYDIDPDTGKPIGAPRPLAAEDVDVYSLAATANPEVPRDRRVSVVACVGSRPMDLVTLPLDAGAPRRRTKMGGRWSERFPWPDMREIDAPGKGGPIHTWIASPAGAGDAALPTIVNIHGGPLGAWAPAPSIEVTLLCARGYRVILPNIRGSTSYGADWIRPHMGNWGGPDADDVHSALDHAIELGLADPPGSARSGCRTAGSWSTGSSARRTGSEPPCRRPA